ncbi:hypothetical protein [Streptomyces sp. NPDC058954]|uniref:hypothetical protein n=1 Tax=Streptomyces sp. NPDC058954 TaxID=3346677 RepID=UPI0036994471
MKQQRVERAGYDVAVVGAGPVGENFAERTRAAWLDTTTGVSASPVGAWVRAPARLWYRRVRGAGADVVHGEPVASQALD